MTAIRVEPTILLLPEVHASGRASGRFENDTDRSVADRFEDLLELHDRAVARGFPRLAEVYADRIIDEMTAGLAR